MKLSMSSAPAFKKTRAIKLTALVLLATLCVLLLSSCGEEDLNGYSSPKEIASNYQAILQGKTQSGLTPAEAYWKMISPKIKQNVYFNNFEVFEKENKNYLWDLEFGTWVNDISYVNYETTDSGDGVEIGNLTLLLSDPTPSNSRSMRYVIEVVKVDGRWYLRNEKAVPINP